MYHLKHFVDLYTLYTVYFVALATIHKTITPRQIRTLVPISSYSSPPESLEYCAYGLSFAAFFMAFAMWHVKSTWPWPGDVSSMSYVTDYKVIKGYLK